MSKKDNEFELDLLGLEADPKELGKTLKDAFSFIHHFPTIAEIEESAKKVRAESKSHHCDEMVKMAEQYDDEDMGTSISKSDNAPWYLHAWHDGGSSGTYLNFCPYCGVRLFE